MDSCKKKAFVTGVFIILGIAFSSAQDPYEVISNEEYGYSVSVPVKWNKQVADLGYVNILILSKTPYTDITITAVKQELKELDKWNGWENWYREGKGYTIQRILETKTVLLEKDLVGRLLLFEYSYKNTRILQKVLIAKYDDNIVTIECRSPVSTYHHYADIFTVVMGSFSRSENSGE